MAATGIYSQPQDGRGNEKYVFNEDEFQRWYVLVTDSSGYGLPGVTVHLRRKWSHDFTKVTGSDGYAVFDLWSYEWGPAYGEFSPFTVYAEFDGDAAHTAASTSDVITVKHVPETPTEIGYTKFNERGEEAETFREDEYIHWIIQLRIGGTTTPIPNVQLIIEEPERPGHAYVIGVTDTGGYVDVRTPAKDWGVGTHNWRIRFPGQLVGIP